MLKLSTNSATFSPQASRDERCLKLTFNQRLPDSIRGQYALGVRPGEVVIPGFGFYVGIGEELPLGLESVVLGLDFNYLGEGDVLHIVPRANFARAIFRANSSHNSFLLTEQCNHYCVMCSQPPKKEDDARLAKPILEAIPLLPKGTRSIGITGGEPTIHAESLINIIGACKRHLPNAGVHVLTNGVNFKDFYFAKRFADLRHPDLMFGIPVYSHIPEIHNFVVQSKNALDSTLHGLLNLKTLGVKVELRVVLHKYTIPTLIELAKFLAVNFPFVDQVAFMGLEATGFAKTNWDDLWIHPRDYCTELTAAVTECARRGMTPLVYNLPLCWLNPRIYRFVVKSISDWKNDFPGECANCAAFSACGGFFSSNLIRGATVGLEPFSSQKWDIQQKNQL